MVCILSPFTRLCVSLCTPPPHPTHTHTFIGFHKASYVDLLVQTLNVVLLTSAKLHCLCAIISQSFPLRICIKLGEMFLT